MKARLSPAEFAVFVLGQRLYPWQVEVLEAVGAGKPTALCAANGSGKTASVIATLILWFLDSFPKGRCPVTSGSWMQVRQQLWPALRRYRERFPGWRWAPSACEVSTPQGGRAVGFATNEAGRAEGWHGTPDAPVMYVVDEAKSVQDEIFTAVDRCTTQFKLYASSAGGSAGQHFRCFHEDAALFYRVRVTAFDCPHIAREKIEFLKAKYGEDSAQYRSIVLSEWTEGSDLLIVPPELLRRALECPPAARAGQCFSFSDFAAGRDENAVAVRCGNSIRLVEAWRDDDTVRMRRRVVRLQEALGVPAARAWGDGSGAGRNVLQDMAEEGFRMRAFLGGAPSEDRENYQDLNADAWFGFARDLRAGRLRLEGVDGETFRQLTCRRMEWDRKGRLRCEPKEVMRARGLHSPDRADAVVGAWWAGRRMLYGEGDGVVLPVSVPENPFAAPETPWLSPF